MEGGDPNIINKVLSEIFKKRDINSAIQMIVQIPDGLRHLRNFAKKRNAEEIIVEIMQIVRTPDYTSPMVNLKNGLGSMEINQRNEQFKVAQTKLDRVKDDFYVKNI